MGMQVVEGFVYVVHCLRFVSVLYEKDLKVHSDIKQFLYRFALI